MQFLIIYFIISIKLCTVNLMKDFFHFLHLLFYYYIFILIFCVLKLYFVVYIVDYFVVLFFSKYYCIWKFLLRILSKQNIINLFFFFFKWTDFSDVFTIFLIILVLTRCLKLLFVCLLFTRHRFLENDLSKILIYSFIGFQYS